MRGRRYMTVRPTRPPSRTPGENSRARPAAPPFSRPAEGGRKKLKCYPLKKDIIFSKLLAMGYVFTYKDTLEYERQRSSFHAMLEIQLLLQMLRPRRGETVLDIGCGTGVSTLPFVQRGLHATGLDPSPHMLEVARQNLGERVDFHQGYAEDLPFDDNSFNN